VPTVTRSRTIHATTQELWEVIADPHHLPRWWPRVTRVESVDNDAFTEVMTTAKGRSVRADFTLAQIDEQARALTWVQQLEGTPFARVLKAAQTEVRLEVMGEPVPGTRVTIQLSQSLNGVFPRLGGYMVRRAAAATLEEALDGLESISGGH
jgi:carbon monoxide dehydrogenase subunit G